MYKKIKIFLVLIFFSSNVGAFTSIEEAWQYAQTLEEYPDTNVRDWTNPDYTEYQYNIKPNFLKRSLQWLHIYTPYFSVKDTITLIKKVTQERELNGYFDRFVQKITPREGECFFLFGDLNGAFHSFLRDLLYLKSINMISNDFSLKKECYLIINGNAIDKSPYLLEMVSLICSLFLKNPEHILYIRGPIEDKEGWLGRTLEYELFARAKNFSSEQIPLESFINRFFNTLPLALFVTEEIDNSIVAIRFSESGLSQKELRSKDIDLFLQSPKTKEHFKLKDAYEEQPKTPKKIHISAFFTLEDRKKSYRIHKGLMRLDDEEGIMSYATLSGPVGTNRRLYDFFYDAFVEIVIGKNLLDSQLYLFYQDVREKNGFSKETEKFLSSIEIPKSAEKKEQPTLVSKVAEPDKQSDIKTAVESKVAPDKPEEKTKKNFVCGCTLDLTRGLAHVTAQHRKGMIAAANRYEKKHNIDIKIIFKDDQYTPEVAKKNVQDFLKEGIDIILEPFGSPTTQAFLDLAKEKKILILFPASGAPLFRDKDIPYILNLRCSYITESSILLERALQLKPNKIAVFYQNDSFGKGGLEGIEKYAKEKNISQDLIVKIPYERNSVDFGAQQKEIQKINPDVIIIIAIATAAREFIRLFNVEFFRGKTIFGVSDLSEKSFLDLVKEKNAHVQTLSTTPSVLSNIEIAKHFREDAEQEKIELDTFAFEGYIGASIIFDALLHINENKDVKVSLLQQIESYKDYNFEGLKLTFNPESRDLGLGTWLYSNEKEWELLKNPFNTNPIENKSVQEVTKTSTDTKDFSKENLSDKKEKSIVFGCTMDLTRGISHVTAQDSKGMLAAAARYKKDFDVDTKIIFKDDQYNPKLARENVEHFLKEHIDIILSPHGSATGQSYLDLVKEKKVLLLFPPTGASIFRNKDIPYIANLRCSYITEGAILLERALNIFKAKKIVIFYQNDAFGNAGLEGITTYAKREKLPEDLIVKLSYERNSVNFSAQVEHIKKINPDVIIIIAVVPAAREFIRLFDVAFFSGKTLLGISDLTEKSFVDFVKEKGISIQVLSATPSMFSDLEIAKNFRQDAKANNVDLDPFAFEGYINTVVALDAFLKINTSTDDIKDSIIKTIESYKNYHFQGLTFTFNPESRDLGLGTWLYSDEKEWQELKDPLINHPEIILNDQQKKEKEISKENNEEKKQEKTIAEKQPEEIIKNQTPSVSSDTKVPSFAKAAADKLADKPEDKTPDKKRSLSVGCTMDLSRGIHSANDQQKSGMLAALQRFGTKSDFNWDIKIIFKDDKYNPATTLEYAENFIKEGIDIILSPSGSPTTVNMLNLVKEKKLMLLFPTTGTIDIRNPDLKYVLNLRPCGCTESKAIISQAINTYNAKKIVIFYQNDAFGRGALSGVEEYEKEHKNGETIFIKIPYGANDVNFTSQVQKIKESNADTLIFLASAIAATGLVRELGVGYFPGKTVFGISELAKKAFLDFAKEKGLRFIYTSILPDPESDIEIAKMFIEDAKKNNFTPDVGAFEGYLDVALFCHMLKNIKTDTSTLQEDIINQFESYKNYNFYGLNLTFNPKMRDASLSVWLYDLDSWKEIKEIK